jgi:hypothetical protein
MCTPRGRSPDPPDCERPSADAKLRPRSRFLTVDDVGMLQGVIIMASQWTMARAHSGELGETGQGGTSDATLAASPKRNTGTAVAPAPAPSSFSHRAFMLPVIVKALGG